MASKLNKQELLKRLQTAHKLTSAVFYDVKVSQQEKKTLNEFIQKGTSGRAIIITIVE